MSAAENMQWFLSDWNMHLSSSFHSSSVSLAYFVSLTDSIGEERLIFIHHRLLFWEIMTH